MKKLLFIFCIFLHLSIIAQNSISGKIVDEKGVAIPGVNIYLKRTYDGTSSNEKGKFSFTTSETGTQILVCSFLSFEELEITKDVSKMENLIIKMREDVNSLDAVIINAGTFEAGEKGKVTVLKPLDVVTTASALGDFVGALQTLPGTSNNAEDGRLFVRGGEAEETQIFIDGIRVFTPFTPSANNTPTRGRHSPFLFDGITFSTGGYSAEYGQALSSVLLLETTDEATEKKTDLQFMTVGLGLGNTQIFGENSLSVNASYINLAPYQALFKTRDQWNKPFQSLSGEAVYRYKTKSDAFVKIYGAFSYTNLDIIQSDINFSDGIPFALENRNLYINASYKDRIGDKWRMETGVSFTNDNTNIGIFDDKITDDENSAHFKLKFAKRFSSRIRLSFGSEYFITDFDENFNSPSIGNFDYGFNNNISGTFVETDIFFSKKLATKIGIRGEYSELLNQFTVSPRASIAYKSGQSSQFSFAYGQFYQNPKNEYLKFNQDFIAENTQHFIVNYQYSKDNQIFRIEAYYKGYDDLVKFDTQQPNFTSNYTNNGSGFAKGIDVFWRQNQKIKNTDYWVSYSYLDTERDYRNYPTQARPNFAAKHNFSLVAKHFITDWKSQVGLSYSFGSGRTYTNPNEAGFLNSQTKNFNSVSLNWAYLIDQQKILYFSVNNVLGTQNVFGYNYANQPNNNGNFDRQAILPNQDSFFFVGFFWTISDNKNDNQLNNL